MTTPRIALVTGANQGLGFALAQGLATRWRPDDRVLLTGRDRQRVAGAAAAAQGSGAVVEGRVLDVRDAEAITALARELQTEHGGIDVVFSNATARMTPEQSPAEQIGPLVSTSNLATTRILRAFAPVLRPGGRLIVVASSFGTLDQLDARLRPRVDAANTLEAVDALVEEWRAAVLDGHEADQGWNTWTNIPSKVLQVAAVRALARDRRASDLEDGTLIAAVCPGLIDTAASRPWFADMSSAQTPQQAATAVLDLATEPVPGPHVYGELVRFGAVLPWGGAVDAVTH